MKEMVSKAAFLAFIGIAGTAGNAQASSTIFLGLEGGSGDIQHVLFNDFSRSNMLLAIDRFSISGRVAQYTGTELLGPPSEGQADRVATAGGFTAGPFPTADSTPGFAKGRFNTDAAAIFTEQNNVGGRRFFVPEGVARKYFSAMGSSDEIRDSATYSTGVSLTAWSDHAPVGRKPASAVTAAEPTRLALVGAGMIGLGLLRSRRRKN